MKWCSVNHTSSKPSSSAHSICWSSRWMISGCVCHGGAWKKKNVPNRINPPPCRRWPRAPCPAPTALARSEPRLARRAPVPCRSWPPAERRARGHASLSVARLGSLTSQRGPRFLQFRALRVRLWAERDQPHAIRPRPRRVARGLGRLAGAGEGAEPVRRVLERTLELPHRLRRTADREQQVSEQLARRQELTGRDRVLGGRILEVRRRPHQPNRLRFVSRRLGRPCRCGFPLDLDLLRPVAVSGRDKLVSEPLQGLDLAAGGLGVAGASEAERPRKHRDGGALRVRA